EFMAMLALNKELPAAFARAGIDREGLLKRVSSHVTPLPRSADPIRRALSSRQLALAAAILAAVGLSLWLVLERSSREFSTAIGEQRTVALPDGSVMYLNAQSTAEQKFAKNGRDITLSEGEALFQVARDPQRPFRVHTRDAVVQAIGT